MSSRPPVTGCAVVGCDEPSDRIYVDATGEAAFRFRVCARHFSRLGTREQPVIIADRFDGEDGSGGSALIMEGRAVPFLVADVAPPDSATGGEATLDRSPFGGTLGLLPVNHCHALGTVR